MVGEVVGAYGGSSGDESAGPSVNMQTVIEGGLEGSTRRRSLASSTGVSFV